jgi:GPH family glycoside/pentoside/hexuronide:cation symporter
MVCSVLSGLLTMALYLPGPEDFYQLHITNILSKLAIAPTIPLLWAMIADTADFSEWKNRRRATGLFFSATTFAQKIGGGFAVAIAGVLLTVANYDGAAVQQTDEALASLRLMFSVIPGALYLLTGGLLLLYHLSDSQLENIRNELEQRRLAERAAA